MTGKQDTEVIGKQTIGVIGAEPLVPTQSDVLRQIGKRLAIGTCQTDAARLDAILYYLYNTASLDDLHPVYNAPTETVCQMMEEGVADDVLTNRIGSANTDAPPKSLK